MHTCFHRRDIYVLRGDCRQQKHTQHAPSTKTEHDYFNDWIKKTVAQMVNPRDVTGEQRRRRRRKRRRKRRRRRRSRRRRRHPVRVMKINTSGTLVTAPSDAWRYWVSAKTGWPGIGTLWMGETAILIFIFYLSMAPRATVWADPSLRYTLRIIGPLCNQPCKQSNSFLCFLLFLFRLTHLHVFQRPTSSL